MLSIHTIDDRVSQEMGVELVATVDGNAGTFAFPELAQGTYTLTVDPSPSRIGYYSYTRTVVAITDTKSASAHLLVPLARGLRESQMMIVVEWGVQASEEANSEGVGVPTDLDVYLRFGVSGGRRPERIDPAAAATCAFHSACDELGLTGVCCPTSDGVYLDCCERKLPRHESCLVYYNSPSCGGAHLVTKSGEGDSLVGMNIDETIGVGDVIAASGVETLFLNPVLETSYALFVRNSALDQPIDTAGLRVNVYGSQGQVGETTQPPPFCPNATHSIAATTGTTTVAAKGISNACPYHDTPLVDDGAKRPFWASNENVVKAEFLRLLCLEYAIEDDNKGTVTSTLVTHECQRYMSATAFAYVSLDHAHCPPADDDACDSASGDDNYWHCSRNVERGIYRCPGGAETMLFCPGSTDICSEPRGGVLASEEDPTGRMCF